MATTTCILAAPFAPAVLDKGVDQVQQLPSVAWGKVLDRPQPALDSGVQHAGRLSGGDQSEQLVGVGRQKRCEPHDHFRQWWVLLTLVVDDHPARHAARRGQFLLRIAGRSAQFGQALAESSRCLWLGSGHRRPFRQVRKPATKASAMVRRIAALDKEST